MPRSIKKELQYTWISYQLGIRVGHFHVCESVKTKVVQKLHVFLYPNAVESYILRLYTSQTHAPSIKYRKKLFSKFDPLRFLLSGVYIVIFLPFKYFWVFLNIHLEHFLICRTSNRDKNAFIPVYTLLISFF